MWDKSIFVTKKANSGLLDILSPVLSHFLVSDIDVLLSTYPTHIILIHNGRYGAIRNVIHIKQDLGPNCCT